MWQDAPFLQLLWKLCTRSRPLAPYLVSIVPSSSFLDETSGRRTVSASGLRGRQRHGNGTSRGVGQAHARCTTPVATADVWMATYCLRDSCLLGLPPPSPDLLPSLPVLLHRPSAPCPTVYDAHTPQTHPPRCRFSSKISRMLDVEPSDIIENAKQKASRGGGGEG